MTFMIFVLFLQFLWSHYLYICVFALWPPTQNGNETSKVGCFLSKYHTNNESCTCISTPLHNFKCLEVMETFRACVFIRKIVHCGFSCHISLYFSFLYIIYVNIPFALFMFYLVQWVFLRLTLPLLWKLFIPIYMFSTVALTEGRLNVQ